MIVVAYGPEKLLDVEVHENVIESVSIKPLRVFDWTGPEDYRELYGQEAATALAEYEQTA